MTADHPPPSPEPARKPKVLWANVAFVVVLPLFVLPAAGWYLWSFGLHWTELLVAVLMWWATGLGITAGYHRLFSHRGYKATAPVRFAYAVLGAAACQNSAVAWCSDHRWHHNRVDTYQDPYNARRGLWYSHMGWILVEGIREGQYNNVPDLKRDPILAWQHRNYLAVAVIGNLLPVLAVGYFTNNLLGMILIAGLLRIIVVQHFTFLINSAAHVYGTQPYSRGNTARDNWFLSFFTLGEGYHNYHHAFQWDYRNGPRWYNFDPTKWLIYSLSRIGLASNLRRVPDEQVLRARFEEGRDRFSELLETWGEGKVEEWRRRVEEQRHDWADKKEAWANRMQERRHEWAERKLAWSKITDDWAHRVDESRTEWIEGAEELKERLHDDLVRAEFAIQTALTELKQQQQEWTAQHRARLDATTADLRKAAQRELAVLARARRNARKKAKEALSDWDALVVEYTQVFGPQMVAA